METQTNMASTAAVFRVYLAHMRRYWLQFTGALACAVGLQAIALVAPLYMRQFFNILAAQTPDVPTTHQLVEILGILALLWVLALAVRRALFYILMYSQTGVMEELYETGFSYLMGHSHHFFISRFAGSLTHRVSKFARAFEAMLDAILDDFLSTFLFVLGAVVVLFWHNHVLGTALGVWAVLFVVFQVIVAEWRQPTRVARSEADTKMTATLADAISNHTTVMLFSGAQAETSFFRSVVAAWRKILMRVWEVDQRIWVGIGVFTIVIQVGLLYGAIVYWSRGLLTIGDFVLIQTYLLTTFERLSNVNRSLRRYYDALADAQEMVAILEEPHEIRDVPGAPELAVARGTVDLKDVTFYFHEERPILEQFNLSIRSREKVALVGPSGAGKSTIVKLLLRLHDVRAGVIEIDEQNIAAVTQDSLRDAIGYVPQEPILFHRSLMENIRYGRRDATDEEVIEAARKAHCHEFIERLPHRYDTYVGERGVKLSGGERQRVAIARAILKDAPILILDEATSSLDSESESLIQDSLKSLMGGKTVIVIAHRLSTIAAMDRVLVIENGTVAADGTHDELLAQGGLYAKLWSIQAGGFLQDAEM